MLDGKAPERVRLLVSLSMGRKAIVGINEEPPNLGSKNHAVVNLQSPECVFRSPM